MRKAYDCKACIAVFCVDAESDDDEHLDAEDEYAQQAYGRIMHAENLKFEDFSIELESALGMAVRNHVHVKRVEEIMAEHGYENACLLNGVDHVAGDEGDRVLYKETLTHLFRQQGYEVTPIVLDIDKSDADADYFQDSANLKNTVAIDGLDDWEVNMDVKSSKGSKKGLRKEKAYFEKLQLQFAAENGGKVPFELPEKTRALSYYFRGSNQIYKRISEHGITDEVLQFAVDVWNGRADLDIN